MDDTLILETAARLVYGSRGQRYGSPYDDFSRTARMWSALFGIEITPHQVAMAMICVKLSRLAESEGHRDSIVDIAGYAETLAVVAKVADERRQ